MVSEDQNGLSQILHDKSPLSPGHDWFISQPVFDNLDENYNKF